MSAILLIALGALALLMIVVLVVGRGPSGRRRPPSSISGIAERENAMAAQFEVEEHDIEEMIEARNALRARIGRPPIGDELAEEVRDDPDSSK